MDGRARVLVVGGGPAGSTAATLLAREGMDVTLMERAVFPRYHIGESLLPACLPILDLLGVREKVERQGFRVKGGAHFDWGAEQWDIGFGDRPGWEDSYSYHVERADFDHLLLEHAKSQGVTVREGVEVKQLVFDGERPTAARWAPAQGGPERELAFDYLVDASGRAGLMTRYLRTRRHHEVFKNVAVWGYWTGAGPIAGPEGAIEICSVTDGWFWGIPLRDDRLSVGLVVHKDHFAARRALGHDLERIYRDAIAESPVMSDLLSRAERVAPLRVEQDYSYAADRFTGPGYFLSGDAACFLDPLLSTGVHLAMYSAMLASACLASTVNGDVSEEHASAHYERTYRTAYLRYLVVVSSLYNQYRGKTSYFWEAQRLTLRDCAADDIELAFANVISGIEDLHDAQAALDLAVEVTDRSLAQMIAMRKETPDRAAAASPQESELAQARAQLFNSGKMGYAQTGGVKAAPGLYLVTKPRLGLAYQSA
ncbi:NAD(P)/FAD-dependent oxidoreductase [Actinokineospora sp. UTMC 2448]|uniref:NAD(P)/FAD-dependent oxidoreductase n=1 Tax=Actinokineospora sp. UTMC 2448 TaxID=2268449 RepID=UPI002164BF0C|nr:NAD(P)/FAD-dependent oxidoreductase [Actinokineospora sp. UTMC 2448]UVS79541.1 3-(3-hydroxyphenyl)propionate hydroxylase [Actinokineospora sp. UTMC 2448]